VERTFWRLIASGVTSEDAAAEVGVSTPVGTRWFRHGGGMSPLSLAEPTGRYLSFAEREEIALLNAQDHGVREIARQIGRDPSTISRELRRNAATRASQRGYRAGVAQWKAQQAAKRPKSAKLTTNPKLRDYVEQRLSGTVTDAEGRPIPGPNVPWVGRRQGRRQDRRWGTAWSPEQISHRLKVDFPEDESMRISHETIYQSLYVQGRGALKRDLSACLRTGRALRVPRARTQGRGKKFVTDEVKISQRPAEVADRAVPGHWEGDLIIGLNKSAIGTLVERTTRYTLLLHLPPMDGHGTVEPVKNGPPLAGHGAQAVNTAIAAQFAILPDQLRRSLTWDQGSELAQHIQLKIDTGLQVYFCDPHSPWQRGTNENTNGLLRQYFPKGTDLSRWSIDELAAVTMTLNSRPRKTLQWRTPAEAFARHLSSFQQAGVASTP
jgi:IS30 family transposase